VSKGDTGNGDTCPINPEHGHMLVLNSASGRQYCAHVGHEARPERDGHPAVVRTPSLWPSGINSFPAAVEKWKETHLA
jgi:hypothetical protein